MGMLIHRRKGKAVMPDARSLGTEEIEQPMEEIEETKEENEKKYTKSEINRMSTADLQALAAENGVENAYDMTGSDLKTLLVDMLVN